MSKAPTLDEIAARIDGHLRRLEHIPASNPKDGYERSRFWGPRAKRIGARVGVLYVSYHNFYHRLSREEAAAYLARLDAGWDQRHCEEQPASE